MEPAHLVGTGGALGATLRYFVGVYLPNDQFPFATFTVNILGSFALGLVTAASVSNEVSLLVGVGVCGSFSTYSSFSGETVRLWETGSPLRAVIYALGTVLSCLLAVGLAWALVALVSG